MTWDYRILRHDFGDLEVVEVFTNEDGTIVGYTPARLRAESANDLVDEHGRMLSAFAMPYLTQKDFDGLG